ncbi:MAG: DUF309 domain-containing protein [Planctomycetes bacterium]|nr:DUF309 domain-containing protein [Planctomycetota bacterium]
MYDPQGDMPMRGDRERGQARKEASPDPRYLRGLDHFNRGEYFEAHEVWEDLWIEVNDDRKGFLHGLIQAAVALHHAGKHNVNGARSLYRRMWNNLENFRPRFMGIDVDRFLERMEACCAPVFREPPGTVDPALLPRLSLDGRE